MKTQIMNFAMPYIQKMLNLAGVNGRQELIVFAVVMTVFFIIPCPGTMELGVICWRGAKKIFYKIFPALKPAVEKE